MNSKTLILVVCAIAALSSSAAFRPRTFKVTADRLAVDNVTKAAVATGHVRAVSEPFSLLSELAVREADGVTRLSDPTTITSCTNHPGICHWSLKGEVEYQDGKYVKGRNVWLEFYEMPIMWLPWFYYPLDWRECGIQILPGYTGRWGAYLLTKTRYHLAGDSTMQEDTWWLEGATRFDLRYRNGIALGEMLDWNLGNFGRGSFNVYYAWDDDYDRYGERSNRRNHQWGNWGSDVERDRYAIELAHRWDITERDILRLKGIVASDSHFVSDFFRGGAFHARNRWVERTDNEIAWEHTENAWALGMSITGPLNDFYSAVGRLPEFYADVAPQPVFGLPVNYESENRMGWLSRKYAKYGHGDPNNPYSHNPGLWADYDTFRFDTYHRLSAPMKWWEVLSVVPRIAYRGTYYGESGATDLTGWNRAPAAGDLYRSILEGGATLSARGTAWLNQTWRHMAEPYLDVLAQKAWQQGSGDRAYVFDSLDASSLWEDQFAGRSRNLPYTYYGITPGWRNAFSKMDEKGNLRQLLDIDVYAALQFNAAEWQGSDDNHKLARPGFPNYGKKDIYAAPGARLRWTPTGDIALSARAEYDPDNNTLAVGDLGFRQEVSRNFSWMVKYLARDQRWWDYSSTPYDLTRMRNDDFNRVHIHNLEVGFTHQPLDWFQWSPFVRWDLKEGEVDAVGSWFDYLTDCLGFRLLVEYENDYTRMDGYRHGDDFDVGFYIYLRALGPDASFVGR